MPGLPHDHRAARLAPAMAMRALAGFACLWLAFQARLAWPVLSGEHPAGMAYSADFADPDVFAYRDAGEVLLHKVDAPDRASRRLPLATVWAATRAHHPGLQTAWSSARTPLAGLLTLALACLLGSPLG